MSDTTDTPITDQHIGMIYRDGSPLIETSRDLERQLAEARGKLASAERREADQIELRELNLKQLTDAREQRDRLAEALRECGKRGANPMTEYGYGNGKPWARMADDIWMISGEALATLDRKEQTL